MNLETKSSRVRVMPQRWRIDPACDETRRAAENLAKQLNLSAVAAKILARRGFLQSDLADAFLSRRMNLLHDPAKLPDIQPAVLRIAKAIENHESIVLFGDYDADGVTSTALLTRFLRLLQVRRPGFRCNALVPERKDGYGLSAAAVANIVAREPNLVIALDNGISAHDPVLALQERGIDCIIVDHHHVGEDIPRALAAINPKRADGSHAYPFAELCGVGLTFKLVWALAVHFSQDKKVSTEFKQFLLDGFSLAAIGTIADVVPLVDENRVIAHHGVIALGRTSIPGLRALMQTAGVDPQAIRTRDVSFRLAPRLNAAGRCGSANEALELLLTNDPGRATELAAKLEVYNAERQAIEDRILQDARGQARARLDEFPDCRGFVLNSDAWHIGVIGIVASRIVEEFRRPALLLAINKESGVAQGSGRSVRGVHLCEALACSREHLVTFGGHAAAAGLTLRAQNIELFRSSFEKTTSAILDGDDLVPSLHLDECVSLRDMTVGVCTELEMFEPCGMGNPRPLLCTEKSQLNGAPRLMGRDEQHVTFFAKESGRVLRAVMFDAREHFNALCGCRTGFDLAFRPQLNTFRGETSVELILEAFKPSN